jgi:hypothetical protein
MQSICKCFYHNQQIRVNHSYKENPGFLAKAFEIAHRILEHVQHFVGKSVEISV